MIEIIQDKGNSSIDKKLYTIRYRKNKRFRFESCKYKFIWDVKIKEFRWESPAYLNLPREVVCGIENILRGLNSNGRE